LRLCRPLLTGVARVLERVGVVDRRLMDAGRDAADTLGRFELTVTGRSRPIEKKWYRDAVRDVRDWLAAMEVFEAWQQSSGYEQVAEEWHRVRVSGEPDPAPYAGVSTRRHLKRERRKTLASIGDPTAPGGGLRGVRAGLRMSVG